MSYIIKHNNSYTTLNGFLLNESIVPVETTFGTNETRDNQHVLEFDDFTVTFFENNNLYYVVGIDNHTGEVGFGVSDTDTLDTDSYNDSKFITTNPVRVFSKVFYVILKLIRYTNTSKVKFDSANIALGKVYDKLVKNKYFLKTLEDEGFEYSGMIYGKYEFEKVSK